MSQVELIPIGTHIYDNLEPQMVQLRSTSTGICYLDSQVNVNEIDKTNMVLSSRGLNSEYSNILFENVSRIKIYQANISYISPNVNRYNSEVKFYSTNTGIFHTVQVDDGFYATAADLLAALITALNTATAASGLTFSSNIVNPKMPGIYSINSAGGDFYFDPNCRAVLYGEQLFNLPKSTRILNSHFVGYMNLYYTRYIDICSNTLNSYSKNSTRSNNINSDIVLRIFIDDPTKPHWINTKAGIDLSVTNFLKGKSVNNIDFQLRDQFGNDLYIPPGAEGTGSGFLWDLDLLCES